jgi:hypothetical protein
MDKDYEGIIDKISDIAEDSDLNESEKESEVADLLESEGLTVEDCHEFLDSEEEESDFLIDPADVDID